jgi:hypothetical protein
MTTIIAEDKPAGTTQIHCPVCRQRDIPAQIIEHIEKVTEYLVVQVNTHTTWWVVCTGCKTRLYSKVSGIELQQRTADQLVGVVVPRVSLVRQFFAVVSVLLSIAPFMGLCIGIIAYLLNRKSPGWPRIASKVGLGITGLVHVAIVLMFVSVALSGRK